MGREVNLESRKTGKRQGTVIRRLTLIDADSWEGRGVLLFEPGTDANSREWLKRILSEGEVNLESRKTGKRRGIVIRRLSLIDADSGREGAFCSWNRG
jgi:hypothetical protein